MKTAGFVATLPTTTILALAAGFWLRKAQPPESPLDRANRICQDCGLTQQEVDQLIDNMHRSKLTREEKLNLFRAQFDDPSDADLCEPCATAILDAAEVLDK